MKIKVKSQKKQTKVVDLIMQIICCFVEGGSRHLTYFDTLRNDPGYAAAIATSPEDMASSHAIKRFVKPVQEVAQKLYKINEIKGETCYN